MLGSQLTVTKSYYTIFDWIMEELGQTELWGEGGGGVKESQRE